MSRVDLSIIIPAFNEEQFIEGLLTSIKTHLMPSSLSYEVIVIDNGSTDRTPELSASLDAKVTTIQRKRISYARNLGVEKAEGEIFAFMDADVRITKKWVATLERELNTIKQKDLITGSRYVVRETPTWIEKNWFTPLSQRPTNYINGGNLIISKDAFGKTGGFSEEFETGEDYEFCMRAKTAGITIESEAEFEAIHDGYPRTSKAFTKREIWHGKGDFASLNAFFSSKVAMLATLFGLLHLSIMGGIIYGSNISGFVTIAFLGILGAVLSMSMIIFKENGLRYIILNIPLCYLYLGSRFVSLISVLKSNLTSN